MLHKMHMGTEESHWGGVAMSVQEYCSENSGQHREEEGAFLFRAVIRKLPKRRACTH